MQYVIYSECFSLKNRDLSIVYISICYLSIYLLYSYTYPQWRWFLETRRCRVNTMFKKFSTYYKEIHDKSNYSVNNMSCSLLPSYLRSWLRNMSSKAAHVSWLSNNLKQGNKHETPDDSLYFTEHGRTLRTVDGSTRRPSRNQCIFVDPFALKRHIRKKDITLVYQLV